MNRDRLVALVKEAQWLLGHDELGVHVDEWYRRRNALLAVKINA